MESNTKEKVTTKHEKALAVWPIIIGVFFGLMALGCVVWLYATAQWTTATIIAVVIVVLGMIVVIDGIQTHR